MVKIFIKFLSIIIINNPGHDFLYSPKQNRYGDSFETLCAYFLWQIIKEKLNNYQNRQLIGLFYLDTFHLSLKSWVQSMGKCAI